jgi:hypothetical protein
MRSICNDSVNRRTRQTANRDLRPHAIAQKVVRMNISLLLQIETIRRQFS